MKLWINFAQMMKMRVITASVLCFLLNFSIRAQSGYEISASIKPFTSGYFYLAYHFGNKQYIMDSAAIAQDGKAVFKGDQPLLGGIYMIVYPQKNAWIECIIDKQQRFSIATDTLDPIGNLRFQGSEQNALFADYQRKSVELGTKMGQLRAALNAPNAKSDSLNTAIRTINLQMLQYRESIQNNHPDHLLSAIFRLLKDPEIPPAQQHPGGKYDSAYAYHYYVDHYWDGVSFSDERLIRTPVLQPKFDRYFNNILPQMSDSLILYADRILQPALANEEAFKFYLSSLTDKYINPQYMGQDAVFVHLFEKYYITGKADKWMNDQYRKFVFDRGYSMMANVIGKRASELPMIDTLGKDFSLYAVQAPYTVLCFWDPTCGHCQEEVPKVDSIFQNKWKKQGMKVVGIMTDGGKENWLNFIHKHNLKDWIHIYQTDATREKILQAGQPGYRQLYDVYQTPMLYLLDKNKNIVAKKLTYLQMDELLTMRDKSPQTP